jgi:hypothetical protein
MADKDRRAQEDYRSAHKPPRRRGPDEDEHPVEGYRDGSVYEEQDDAAYSRESLAPQEPTESRTSAAGRGDNSRAANDKNRK